MTGPLATFVQERLATWLPGVRITATPDGAAGAVLVWRGPQGTVRYRLEFKDHLPQQDIQVLAHRLERLAKALPKAKVTTKPFLLAPYIPQKQAEFLRGRSIDYADEAGNAHLAAPGLFVHVEGKRRAQATTVHGGITKGWVKVTLAGLLHPPLFEGPYHRLADAAGVTPPTVMTCLRDLKRRGLLDVRGRRRRLVGGRELLPLWVQAYLNTLRPTLRQRGFRMLLADGRRQDLERLAQVLGRHGIPWCLTGAAAALQLTNYYQTDIVEVYAAPDAMTDAVARELRAQPAERDANLLVIEPPIPGVATRPGADLPRPIAPALLAYAELRYHGTGQAAAAAELLLPLIEAPDDPTARP